MILVVDGAVDLPLEMREAPDVRTVQQDVWLDGQRYTGSSEAFWTLLRDGRRFSTAPPTVSALATVYSEATEACAVHVSSNLSATVARAREAAERSPSPVAVVDSRSLSVGAGLVAALAYRAMGDGGAWADFTEHAGALPDRVHTFVLVADVDTLRRSERTGLLPSVRLDRRRPALLAVRGRALLLDQPKHHGAGLGDLVAHARHSAGGRVRQWAMGHGDCRDPAAIRERLADAFGTEPWFSCTLDPVVGAHVGPDAIVVGVC